MLASDDAEALVQRWNAWREAEQSGEPHALLREIRTFAGIK